MEVYLDVEIFEDAMIWTPQDVARGRRRCPVDIDRLGVSAQLRAQLDAWREESSSWDVHEPVADDVSDRWAQERRRLAHELQKELEPGITVLDYSHDGALRPVREARGR